MAVVIPAYEPDDRLISLVKELARAGFANIIVVDDGSGEGYKKVFDQLEAIVLHHDANHGKGRALKTGFRHVQVNHVGIYGVVTIDADGQHRVQDCMRIADNLQLGKDQLILGNRDFNLPAVPPRSRVGNKVTSVAFRLLYGQYLPDTQTGLRAFPASLLPFMMGITGERYEYELNVLVSCVRAAIPIVSVPVETIYEDNNEGTHFHLVKDSWRVCRALLGSFLKYAASSVASMLIDQGLFNLLNLLVFANGDLGRGEYILASTVISRMVSSYVNFTLNRNLVFKDDGSVGRTFYRYTLLCMGIMLLSAAGTWGLSTIGVNSSVAKAIVDTLLFFVSYGAQRRWVFTSGG